MDLSEKVAEGSGDVAVLLEYLWESTPQFVVYVAPLATLVAVLGTIGGLTRTSELTVMRSCGVSLYRVALPLLVLALLWSGLLYLLQEDVLGRQPARRRARRRHQLRGREAHTVTFENRNWLASGDGRVFYYREFEAAPGRIAADVSIFQTTPGRTGSVHTFASERSVDPAEPWQGRAAGSSASTRANSRRAEFRNPPIELPPPSSVHGLRR